MSRAARVIVIPARMASTRFPGKPMVRLAGKPMVEWVYRAALASQAADRIIVTAPDPEILAAAEAFGAETCQTHDRHPSGTDRLAEVAEKVQAEHFVNVQGDEPLIAPANIALLFNCLEEAPMATLWTPCNPEDEANPAAVKVVADLEGNALYFSRSPIPFARNPRESPLKRHLGLYGYHRETLRSFATWPQTELERTEGLEQLRFLEHGVKIRLAEGIDTGPSVDLPEQAAAVEAILLERLEARGA
jgi:3-deoxy-manno-octulosonate cytidylyltransferase (CMP-KDO synthetase)